MEVSAGKSNTSKWNINGIHFLAIFFRNTLEVQGGKSHCKNNCFFFNITKWHWKDQNARFQGNNWTLRYHYLFIRQFLG